MENYEEVIPQAWAVTGVENVEKMTRFTNSRVIGGEGMLVTETNAITMETRVTKVMTKAKRIQPRHRSKYLPHQGAQECERRAARGY